MMSQEQKQAGATKASDTDNAQHGKTAVQEPDGM